MLFTVEGVRGPDDWLQYVATFWYRGGNYLFCCVHRVGGKGLQLINELSVEPDRVILGGNTYRSTDAVCCPSRPMTAAARARAAQAHRAAAANEAGASMRVPTARSICESCGSNRAAAKANSPQRSA
jgi:hypothetical protein